MKRLTDSQINSIESLYLSGKSLNDIAKIFGTSSSVVSYHARRIDLQIRTTSDVSRKYDIDTCKFKCPETEEDFYFFGLLMGDGNMAKDRPRVKIALQSSDKNLLEKFSHYLEYARPLAVYKNNTTLVIDSVEIYNNLSDLGLKPCKSMNEIVPSFVKQNPQMARHFWRGIVDADGSIGLYSKYKMPRINLLSSIEVINEFVSFGKELGNSTTSNCLSKHCKSEVYYGTFNGKFAIPVIHDLYRDCSIFLERKYSLAKEIVNNNKYKIDLKL